jgi:hypothetical protein
LGADVVRFLASLLLVVKIRKFSCDAEFEKNKIVLS